MAVPPRFPSDEDINRIKEENGYYRLYKSILFNFDDTTDKRTKFLLSEFFADDREKMKLLTVAMNIAPSLVRAGTNFLFGKKVKIEVSDDTEGKSAGAAQPGQEPTVQARIDRIVKNNKLHKKLKASSRMLQAVGHTQFKFRKGLGPDGETAAIIEEIPFDSFIPKFDGLMVGAEPSVYYVVAYLSKTNAVGNGQEKYIYVEEHAVGSIEYSLWKDQGGKTSEQVPLDTLVGLLPEGATLAGLTAVQRTGLTENTILQLDCDKDVKDRVGVSILKQVEPLLNEINMRLTQVSLQMLKHLDPLLEMPATAVPLNKDGSVDRKKLEILFTQAGDIPSRYVTNDNPLIEHTFAFLRSLVLAACKLTDTPPEFVWESEKGGVESAESIKSRFMLFFMRVDNYRDEYDDGLKRMSELALRIEGVTVPDDAEIKNTFDYGLPRNLEVDGTVWGQAVLNGIASVETAVRQFQGLEDDLLDEEMKRIKDDQAAMAPVGFDGTPVPPGKTPVPPGKAADNTPPAGK